MQHSPDEQHFSVKESCRKSGEAKRCVFLHHIESSIGPLQIPVLAQLFSLREDESSNMMDVAMLLKAQALSLTKHIRIKTANLSQNSCSLEWIIYLDCAEMQM